MANSAKAVSIRALQTAVKSAVEVAKKKHPDIFRNAGTSSGSSDPDSNWLYIRFPWFCGYPAGPWPDVNLQNLTAFTQTFTTSLQNSPQIALLARDGVFEPAINITGKDLAIGFVPSDVLITD